MTSLNRRISGRALGLALSLALIVLLLPACAFGETLTYDYKGEGVSDLTTELIVTKVDQNRLYVKDAVLGIYRADNDQELVRWKTEEDDRIFDRYINKNVPLNVDTHYVIKEIETPDGYKKIEDTEFYIDKYGSAVIVSGKDAKAENRNQIVLTDVRLLATETDYIDQEKSGSNEESSNKLSEMIKTGDPLGMAICAAIAVAIAAAAVGAVSLVMRKRSKNQ